jgi:hypothetical protein
MTTIQETIPTASKTRLVWRVLALILAYLFGLFAGFTLSPANYFASSIVLGFLIPLALLVAILDLKRALPIQNIVVIVVLIVLISGVLEIANAMSAFPSGSEDDFHWFLGRPLFHLIRWRVPLLWAVNLLNSRSVARLMLRPWRDFRNYGLLSLGVTIVLTAISNFSIEYFGGRLEPWPAFFIYAMIATVVLVAATPWSINKKPGLTSVPGFFPLLIWVTLLSFLFGLCDVVS